MISPGRASDEQTADDVAEAEAGPLQLGIPEFVRSSSIRTPPLMPTNERLQALRGRLDPQVEQVLVYLLVAAFYCESV